MAQLDPSRIYGQYAPVGGEAIAPEILLGLLFYVYATAVDESTEKSWSDVIALRKAVDPCLTLNGL